jgi:hypothetical protein
MPSELLKLELDLLVDVCAVERGPLQIVAYHQLRIRRWVIESAENRSFELFLLPTERSALDGSSSNTDKIDD